jgi:DNA-binding NarL/FixJ family response regulator
MPKVNGLEAVTCFRSSYQSIPVIVMTGKPDDQYARRMLEQGISAYLVKPLERETLLAALRKAL